MSASGSIPDFVALKVDVRLTRESGHLAARIGRIIPIVTFDEKCRRVSCRATISVGSCRAPAAISTDGPSRSTACGRDCHSYHRAVERLGELLDSADERIRLEAARTILDRHLGRPAIQADLTLHRAEADGHLAALLEVARRRAAEPIMLEDVEVEVMATDPLPRSR
jgi:hypothetical protein